MNYEEKISELLEKNMTERGFKLWLEIKKKIPNIWDKLTSASKKHHRKENGHVPSVAEHTYEMLYAADKILRLFTYQPKSNDIDVIFLSIVLHDSLKYGIKEPEVAEKTDNNHDKLIADVVLHSRDLFMKLLNEPQFEKLEESLRYHMGKWSTDWRKGISSFNHMNHETFFVHVLDMLSANNCIKIVNGENLNE